MTPHLSHGRGTLVIDRLFKETGRIRRASGTTDPEEFAAINVLLTKLYRRRRLDYLEAVRDGRIHPLELYLQVDRLGMSSFDSLPHPSDLVPIADAWQVWVEGTPRRNTQRMYRLAWSHLAAHLPPRATVGDLAPALLVLRGVLRANAPTFNRVRASAQAFVKHHAGTKHAAYAAIDGVEKLRERAKRREGLRIDRVLQIRDALPAEEAATWWSLVLTGMRVGELYQREGATWSVEGEAVVIHGSKTENADRVVPLLAPPVAAAPEGRFRTALRAHGLTPHVARYSFKALALDAGIPEVRVEQYMGRSVRGMAGLYGRVNLREWVAQDRTALLGYLAAAEQAVAQRRRGGLQRA